MKIFKVCNQGLVEDEYHVFFTWLPYSKISDSFDDILQGSNKLYAILETPPRRLSTYV